MQPDKLFLSLLTLLLLKVSNSTRYTLANKTFALSFARYLTNWTSLEHSQTKFSSIYLFQLLWGSQFWPFIEPDLSSPSAASCSPNSSVLFARWLSQSSFLPSCFSLLPSFPGLFCLLRESAADDDGDVARNSQERKEEKKDFERISIHQIDN